MRGTTVEVAMEIQGWVASSQGCRGFTCISSFWASKPIRLQLRSLAILLTSHDPWKPGGSYRNTHGLVKVMHFPGQAQHLIPFIVFVFLECWQEVLENYFRYRQKRFKTSSMYLCPVEEVVRWKDCWFILAGLMLTHVPQWESVSLSILSYFFWCVWHITMALRSVHMNKHEKKPGLSPWFTCRYPGPQDPQSIHLILYQITNSESAYFLCNFFP